MHKPGISKRPFCLSLQLLLWKKVLLMRTLTIEGYIIGLFVIFNGIYVVTLPPAGDEPQGYAIIGIGIFIIIATQHLVRIMEKNEECPPLQ